MQRKTVLVLGLSILLIGAGCTAEPQQVPPEPQPTDDAPVVETVPDESVVIEPAVEEPIILQPAQNRISPKEEFLLEPEELIKGVKKYDPETFLREACVYVHGHDSEINRWQDLSETQRLGLSKLLSELPFTYLDYSANPFNTSDQVLNGPLCTCPELARAEDIVDTYKLQMPDRLIHGYETLTECFDPKDGFMEG